MAANPNSISGKRLDSWKEIAAFLGRAERTVKRWETERGLPVHRVPGGGRSAVFAYTHELADWLKGKDRELDSDNAGFETGGDKAGAKATGSDAVEAAMPRPDASPLPAHSTRTSTAAYRKGIPVGRLLAWLVPIGLAAGLGIFLWIGHERPAFKALANKEPSSGEMQSSLGTESVAVLPFVNLRGGPETEYLSDGITESLIGSLAHIPRLKVRSRDSVFRYKGKDVDIRTIGNTLGVSALVSGRVMEHNDETEVSIELTDIRDNTAIWSHRYRSKNSDIVLLQQQIAGDIARQLRSSISSADRQKVIKQGTQNAEAYSFYLKGRYAWNKRTPDEMKTAIADFNQAIDKDPEYALAYAGLADVYSVMIFFEGNPREDFPKSNAAARRALELDPTLAHPHAVLAVNEMEYDWDFAGGESEFKKAIELDPNDATAHQWYAEKLTDLGRYPQALEEINRAHELDPLSPVITRVLGGTLAMAGRDDEAITICKALAAENPAFAIAHDCLYYAYWQKRMYAPAIEELKANANLMHDPDELENSAALERGFHSGGWTGAAHELIATIENRRKTHYGSPFVIARLYADLGEKEKALEWLDTAYREHDCLLIELKAWPQFASLHADPRFAGLADKIGLPR